MTDKTATTQVYRIVIKASAQAIWDAITKPEWTERYAYGGRVDYELKAGGRYHHEASAEMKSMGLPDELILGEVIESDPPRKLVQTWHPQFTPEMIAEPPTRLTYEIKEGRGRLHGDHHPRRHGRADGRRHGAWRRRSGPGRRRLAVGAQRPQVAAGNRQAHAACLRRGVMHPAPHTASDRRLEGRPRVGRPRSRRPEAPLPAKRQQ